MQNKVCLISPYYGIFPNYFHLWIESASHNPKIDFYIITDSEFNYSLPPNIHQIHLSLNGIKERVERITGLKVCLSSGYKLCDYRPAYGLIFDDFVKNYDFWGWCDPDVVFGDLSLIVNKETMDEYDVIGGGGAFSLFRNTELLKTYYLYTTRTMPSYSFNEVRTTDKNLIFDEWAAPNIRKSFRIKETSQYEWLYKRVLDVIPPDTSVRHSNMYIRFCEYPVVAEYQSGHVFAYAISSEGIVEKKEYAYCHLQKRKMNILTRNDKSYVIYNEMFLPSSMLQECVHNQMLTKPNGGGKSKKTWKTCKFIKAFRKPFYPSFLRLFRMMSIYKKLYKPL